MCLNGPAELLAFYPAKIVATKIKVILNPYGGRLPKEAKITLVEQALGQVSLDYHLELTTRRGQGIELARQAWLEGWPVVAAAGGDGMVNEVSNGLLQAAGEAEAGTLGIIPVGTANDLAEMLHIPFDVKAACQRLAAGATRLIDVGEVNGHYFVNNSAVGLEPVVTEAHDRMRWVKGNLRYILAALKTLAQARPWYMRLSWGDSSFEGFINLVSIGNSNRTGGFFYMTPHARPDDGLLDFIYAAGLSRWQMLQLLPQTFKGAHVHHPQVAYHQTASLSITASPPTLIQTDGEILPGNATEIVYRLIPRKLRVIV
ncbi:MAG: diacylglycerol kinase family lipid kinase [Anaerolineae bacterium]|nr:diacylglycerol kinase family lipid kinase [Anaerolineae bacterium]